VVSWGTIVDLAISGAKSCFGNVVHFDSRHFIPVRGFQTRVNVKRTSWMFLANNSHLKAIPTAIPVSKISLCRDSFEHNVLAQPYILSKPTVVSRNLFWTHRSLCRFGVIIEFLPHTCGLVMEFHPYRSCKVIRIPAALTVEKNTEIFNVVPKQHA